MLDAGAQLEGALPCAEVVSAKGDTEDVRGNKAGLRGLQSDETQNHAIDRGDHPSLPQSSPYQNGGSNRQQTRDVIEAKNLAHALIFIRYVLQTKLRKSPNRRPPGSLEIKLTHWLIELPVRIGLSK